MNLKEMQDIRTPELVQAILDMNVEKGVYLLRKYGYNPSSRAAVELFMHKTRYESAEMPRKFRLESGDWLWANGYKRLNGLPLLPKGELPK